MGKSAERSGTDAPRSGAYFSFSRRSLLLAVILGAITVAAFAPLRQNAFISTDDDVYITHNPHVATGFSAENVAWAFSSAHSSNWHPLTWLSHMLDVTLFGLVPGPHHLVGLAFHTANAVLLFLLFVRMTGAISASAFVAFLFALHPLHVESVAWASERKDVLSTFFWILTLWAYARYAERPVASRYLALVGLFVLGLLSKPMLVTLPLVLLLLDVWPLSRTKLGWRWLVVEKLPLMALSATSSLITLVVQWSGGSVAPIDRLNASVRVQNAIVSDVMYLVQTLWPTDLAFYYPYDESLAAWKVVASGAAVIGMTSLAIALFRRVPAIAVGWFWYLVTLVPVIGLVQVGKQSHADRYTYVPLIGIFLAVAWGVAALVGERPARRKLAAIAAATILLACAALTRRQVALWKDNQTLYEHTVAVTKDNAFVHYNLGYEFSRQGDPTRAVSHYVEAVRISPNWFDAQFNLGNVLRRMGRFDEAAASFRRALSVKPNDPDGLTGLGLALEGLGDLDAARLQLREALRINPSQVAAREALARIDAARAGERKPSGGAM